MTEREVELKLLEIAGLAIGLHVARQNYRNVVLKSSRLDDSNTALMDARLDHRTASDKLDEAMRNLPEEAVVRVAG